MDLKIKKNAKSLSRETAGQKNSELSEILEDPAIENGFAVREPYTESLNIKIKSPRHSLSETLPLNVFARKRTAE